jgi:spermidine/putrescine transport system substrate-binding protein
MMRLTALLTGTTLLVCAASAQAADLHVLNWKGYGADEPWAVAQFEEMSGHTVVNDFFNSEQEMLTKLRTNPGQPIDTSALTNYAGISLNRRGPR